MCAWELLNSRRLLQKKKQQQQQTQWPPFFIVFDAFPLRRVHYLWGWQCQVRNDLAIKNFVLKRRATKKFFSAKMMGSEKYTYWLRRLCAIQICRIRIPHTQSRMCLIVSLKTSFQSMLEHHNFYFWGLYYRYVIFIDWVLKISVRI